MNNKPYIYTNVILVLILIILTFAQQYHISILHQQRNIDLASNDIDMYRMKFEASFDKWLEVSQLQKYAEKTSPVYRAINGIKLIESANCDRFEDSVNQSIYIYNQLVKEYNDE